MNNSPTWTCKKTIMWSALILFIIVIGYFSFHTPYVLRPDRFHNAIFWIAIIFTPLVIVEIVMIKGAERKKEKYFPVISLILGVLLFIIGSVKTAASMALAHSDIPFIKTNAFVTRYTQGRGSPDYELLFADNQAISSKKIIMHAQTHAQTGDCLSVRYRENALIIEVRTTQNLGKRTQKECLKEKFFRQPEKTHTPHKNAIISGLLN